MLEKNKSNNWVIQFSIVRRHCINECPVVPVFCFDDCNLWWLIFDSPVSGYNNQRPGTPRFDSTQPWRTHLCKTSKWSRASRPPACLRPALKYGPQRRGRGVQNRSDQRRAIWKQCSHGEAKFLNVICAWRRRHSCISSNSRLCLNILSITCVRNFSKTFSRDSNKSVSLYIILKFMFACSYIFNNDG